jgi:DNA-binding XRE family transcriptional regulator
MKVQFKDTAQGRVAILPRSEYERLKAIEREAGEDQGTVRIVRQARQDIAEGAVLFPLSVVDCLANGENPIRVLRRWRDMTQEELSVSVGIPQGYLSDLETGKRKGPLELHRKLAKALGVPLDVLAGEAVSEEEANPTRSAKQRKTVLAMKRSRSQR